MPLTYGAISVGASLIGGLIGQAAASGDRQAARDAAQKAYDTLINTGMPPDQSKALILKQFQSAGNFTPAMQQDIEFGVSKAAQVQANPDLQKAQMGALQQMQARGQVGLTPEDRAALAQSMSGAEQQTRGNTQAILQAAQARGQGGAGSTLAAQLIAAQQGGNRASQSGLDIGAQASRNALQAMGQSGQMAGQIEQQQFGQQMQKASAADEFSRLNTQSQIARQQQNVGQQNQAQLYNLQQGQQLQNMNTQQGNQEQLRQQAAQEQYWRDSMNRAQAIANAANGQATQLNQQGNAAAQQYAGIGAGIGQAAAAMGAYKSGQKSTLETDASGNPVKHTVTTGWSPDTTEQAFNGQGQS